MHTSFGLQLDIYTLVPWTTKPMSRPLSQARITNYLSSPMQVKSEPQREASAAAMSNQHNHFQTESDEHGQASSNNISLHATLPSGRGQVIESCKSDSGTKTKEAKIEDMEPQERRSLRSGAKKKSSISAAPRHATRTRDELRELAEIGDAAAAAGLENIRAKGRDSQKRRDERAAAGMPGAVASKEKDRQRSRDLSALRSSTAQLKQQIDNGDKAAVGTLRLLQEGYLAKYPKSKLSIVSSLKLGNANIQPAKRRAMPDDDEANKTQGQATGKRTKRKVVVDDSEDDDEDETPPKRHDEPKLQEEPVVPPVQGSEAVAPRLRWHKGRTIRSSHDQHGKLSPGGATPDSASVAAPNGTDVQLETETVVHEPGPTREQVTAPRAVMPSQTENPERTTTLPTIRQPTTNTDQIPPPNIIDLEDTDVEFVESRPVLKIFKNTPARNTMSSIYDQLGSLRHQKNVEDDVEYTKLQIRKKEIEEEKIELQLKLRRQERAQAVRESPGSRVEIVKTETPHRESAGVVGKVE
ncbi:hypothetical protein HII31_03684 [Pseudocercospora fuligena]|uniref:Uncharacterized protein n=1 Tax=Pseudocercospora fuligena TaxID=685502 RepID=A0A8H6VKH0_9PEZI|nr:hypothetical protein HII31_03684 [Pseudocercospora fuligena]